MEGRQILGLVGTPTKWIKSRSAHLKDKICVDCGAEYVGFGKSKYCKECKKVTSWERYGK